MSRAQPDQYAGKRGSLDGAVIIQPRGTWWAAYVPTLPKNGFMPYLTTLN
jgi:hypothetical protein